jgi:hypothetical protein
MAEAAISALLGANNAAHDLFPMELIIRQSCGCGEVRPVIAHGAAETSGKEIIDSFDYDRGYGSRRLDRMRWLPSARVCEIITVPNRADRHIQRGGQT